MRAAPPTRAAQLSFRRTRIPFPGSSTGPVPGGAGPPGRPGRASGPRGRWSPGFPAVSCRRTAEEIGQDLGFPQSVIPCFQMSCSAMARSAHYDVGGSGQIALAGVSTAVSQPDVSKITKELTALPAAQAQPSPEPPCVSCPPRSRLSAQAQWVDVVKLCRCLLQV
jgi:hypothetical protein